MKSRWADYLKMARAILQGGYEAGQDGRNRGGWHQHWRLHPLKLNRSARKLN